MDSSTSPPVAFSQAIRSFQTGGVSYRDLMTQLRRQVASGASPRQLLEVLERREYVEPLPSFAHDAIVLLLKRAAGEIATTADPDEDNTVILENDEPAGGPAPLAADSPSARGSPAAHPGALLLGRYRLLELIGAGGLGRVFKAVDEADANRVIALKVLNRPFEPGSAAVTALAGHVRALERLAHPHIVHMMDCRQDGTRVFTTMEFLPGISLSAALRADRANRAAPDAASPALPAARSVLEAVADAMEYAHRHGVVHGDLKPGNVILSESGGVKVIDFGLAEWVSVPPGEPPRALPTVTPRYASPQLMAREPPGVTDDVYALACLAYELFTGQRPFERDAPRDARPPPRPGLTPDEYAAVIHGLERQRDARTGSVRQFMDEFRSEARPADVPPPEVPPPEVHAIEAAEAGALLVASQPPDTWAAAVPRTESWAAQARRTRRERVGAAALLAFALAVAGIWLSQRHGPAVNPPAAQAPSTGAPVTRPAEPTAAAPLSAPAAGTELRDCATCPLLVVVPPGTFQQGVAAASPGAARFEQPLHEVRIAQPFAMSITDVTVGDFRDFIAATHRPMLGCDVYGSTWHHDPHASWQSPGFAQSAAHPVTCTSWQDATAFADWLSQKTGHRYRLPSAAEWEYAARAGATATRPWDLWGGTPCDYANVADRSAAQRYPGWSVFACSDRYVHTSPVGSFEPNAFHLSDMLGNLFQWTQDCWHADYRDAPPDGRARLDGGCAERELRGGSWFTTPAYVDAGYRNHFDAGYRTSSVGFRLVRELAP